MDTWYFLVGLFLFTIAAVLVFSWASKRGAEKKLNDPDASKSSLAKDGPGPNPVTAPRAANGGANPRR